MKRLFLSTLVALGLLYSGSALAATTLSDTELAGVSGGGIDPHLEGQSLPQEQQQPGSNNSGYTPLRQPQSIDGMELIPELFAILQSRIDVERERRLLLNGTTQQNAIALNLDNVLSSDTISSTNIFDGGSLSLDDVTTGIEINQRNDLSQRHRTQGNLTSSIASHRYEKSELHRSGTESYEYHTYSFIDQNRINEYQSTNWRGDSVELGETFNSLGEMVPEIITSTQKGWLNTLRFHVDELNHGSGVDIKGSWYPRPITDPERGSLNLSGKANIKIKILWWTWKIEVDLFNVKKTYTVMDKVVAESGDPGYTVETEDRDDDLVEECKAIYVAESSFSESYEHSVFTGGQMTGAEAELLALSDGSLSVDNSSVVSLNDSAQQNMRILHGVNAVSSIAANSLNISLMPSFSMGAAKKPQISLRQQNLFTQQL